MPKESRQLADGRTDTLRGLHIVTVYRTAIALHKKHKGYTNISQLTARPNIRVSVGVCCMPAVRDAACGQ